MELDWLPMDNYDTMERDSLCSLHGENGKARQSFEQDEESSADYTFQRLELFRNYKRARVLYVFLLVGSDRY